MAKRPYYYKAQLLDAISLLESGRAKKALWMFPLARKFSPIFRII
jgi:hypothetical protein